MKLQDLTAYLDDYLQIQAFSDAALNGLQVENNGKVTKIALAVDACLETIRSAADVKGTLLIVHHGLFWGKMTAIRNCLYKRIRALIQADMALYAVHLPLDAHQEVGHNIEIAKKLALQNIAPFGRFGGTHIGFQGRLDTPVSVQEATALCQKAIGPTKLLLQFGPGEINRFAIISGSASDPEIFEEACQNKIDLLITGEPKQAAYYLAQEFGLNIFYGGHYQTETFGLKALEKNLKTRFDVPTQFIETECPL